MERYVCDDLGIDGVLTILTVSRGITHHANIKLFNFADVRGLRRRTYYINKTLLTDEKLTYAEMGPLLMSMECRTEIIWGRSGHAFSCLLEFLQYKAAI